MNLFRILTEKPWQHNRLSETGLAEDALLSLTTSPQKVALMFFLAVVTVLFGLFITAYIIRMELDDWRPMPESGLLWFNTALLFLSSIALQWTRHELRQGATAKFRFGLLAGALLTIGFVFGQLAVWQQMVDQGYYLYSNPANSFFYVLTGIHGIHILGGLWVWTRAGFRVWSGAGPEQVRLAVELCAVYWHFLLLVWLVLFGLISYT